MKSPWKSFAALDPDTVYHVFASAIPVTQVRSAPAMFRGSRAVGKQLASSDGMIGFSLLAKPFAKSYATLSVWRDQAALDAFTAAHPHDRLMEELAPQMGPTRFVSWEITGSDGKPTWDQALERLAAADS